MKFCVLGTGGVGGYFGGRLANAGNDVTFVARGRHLDAMKEKGLEIKSINGDILLSPVKAVAEPQGDFDCVIVATKVWQIESLRSTIQLLASNGAYILPLENGIEAVEILASMVSREQILGGLCRIFSWIESPGIIKHAAYDPSITFGELSNEKTERVTLLSNVFTQSGIRNTIAGDIEQEIWKKFLFIASTSTVGAVTGVPFGLFCKVAESRELLFRVMSEMVRAGMAHGVNIDERIVASTMEFTDKMPADSTTSMQRDILEGKPSELDAQLGAIIRLAQKYAIEVPVCKALYAALLPREMVARGISPL
jgi:2-dehydropantoate 2-reductase